MNDEGFVKSLVKGSKGLNHIPRNRGPITFAAVSALTTIATKQVGLETVKPGSLQDRIEIEGINELTVEASKSLTAADSVSSLVTKAA